MISSFQKNQHFRKVSVNKTFTHVQGQKKAMLLRHSAYIPLSVKSPLEESYISETTPKRRFLKGFLQFSGNKHL